MTTQSRHSYADTLALLSRTILNAGNTIFATIDQAAAASGAGLTLRPTTLLIFGNPKAGTPIMDAFPLTALDLPLKLIVWEDRATVSVAYVPMADIAARYGVTGMDDRIVAIDAALEKLVSSVT